MDVECVEGDGTRWSAKANERLHRPTKGDLDQNRVRNEREHAEGKLRDAYGIPRDQTEKDGDEFCKSL